MLQSQNQTDAIDADCYRDAIDALLRAQQAVSDALAVLVRRGPSNNASTHAERPVNDARIGTRTAGVGGGVTNNCSETAMRRLAL